MTFWGVTVYRNKNSWGDGGKNLGSNTFLELVVSFSHSSGSEYCRARKKRMPPEQGNDPLVKA